MSNKNLCIKCTVDSCANHSKDENYCALEKVEIGKQLDYPNELTGTMCNSFEPTDCKNCH